MTADPYKSGGGVRDPGSWNRYAYVLNDPINQRDPTGLCIEEECGDGDSGGFEDGGMQIENAPAFDAGLIASVTATAMGDPDPEPDDGGDPGIGSDDDPNPGPSLYPIPSPISTATAGPNNCVAGSMALGAMIGGSVLGPVIGTIGAGAGAVGGTFVGPGVGTIGVGIAGGVIGDAAGTLIGAAGGGFVGGILGNILCSGNSGSNSGQGKGERGTTGTPHGTNNPGKHAKLDPKTGRWLVKNPHTGKTVLKPKGWQP